MKSILQKERQCFVCHTTQNLHLHHVFYGWGLRKQSDIHGLTIYLCGRHHNLSNEGVHFNTKLDTKIKRWAQKEAMQHYGWTEEQFRKKFIRSYL